MTEYARKLIFLRLFAHQKHKVYMKKTTQGNLLLWTLTGLLLFISPGAFSQNSSIDELHFPYTENYVFHLSGEKVVYDKYNFPSKTYRSTIKYRSYDVRPTKKGKVMKFELREISDEEGSDSNDVRQSFLTLDNKGMSWYTINEKTGKKEKTTQAIKLPLTAGSSWTTMLWGNKAPYLCLHTDTVIETSEGRLQAFSVKSVTTIDSKDYIIVVEWVEYYSQYLGKIGTDEKQYVIIKADGRTLNLQTEKLRLSYCNIDDETRKKLQFAE